MNVKPRHLQFFMDSAALASKMSHAQRNQVGCVIVKGRNIIAHGWNGTPKGSDNVCEVDGVTKPEVIHAEMNAIAKVAQSTESTKDSSLFVTLSPCFECAKLILASGIKQVVYLNEYRDITPLNMLRNNGVQVINYSSLVASD